MAGGIVGFAFTGLIIQMLGAGVVITFGLGIIVIATLLLVRIRIKPVPTREKKYTGSSETR